MHTFDHTLLLLQINKSNNRDFKITSNSPVSQEWEGFTNFCNIPKEICNIGFHINFAPGECPKNIKNIILQCPRDFEGIH